MNDLKELDWEATVALNDWGNDTVDLFFNIVTHKLYSIPFYLVLLFFFYNKLGWKNTLISVVTIAILIAASDQIANLFKDGFERLRPFREPALEGVISKVGRSGGTYGFYSAHSSSAIGLATFVCLLLWKSQRVLCIITIIWAILVAYSRVYLGLHYLGDILMGAVMGVLLGIICFKLFAFAKAKYGSTSIQ
ncbi:transmembrane PAP2 superfamily protein [Nonlabens sp. YIK11]|uniref:phosphatase PAP2 family protein n=1 Tax=Nonlabens sp. YIK11 TaxID=1453349 RepID=UPI0006DCDD64|nr:phosphatase PAP2 family protein [Nonlabens sp. YIK11]KQC34116.1 transmembrane PAP2 superfamily protein [Nonlabens sp. YIK11]